MTCKECVHFDVCEALENGNGIKKVYPTQCGCFKNNADIVEVVRCQDCAYANENGTTCHYGVGHYTSPMRYCSEGERRDGADNER